MRSGRGRAAAAVAAAWLAPAPLAAVPARCRATASFEPARAFVGQQVLYRIRILRRRDVTGLEWQTPLSFPAFRVEWLPGLASDDREERDGETYLAFVERRAVFPANAGQLRIPPASLRCSADDGAEIAEVAPVTLVVDDLPAEGRPPGFAGLLGPVAVSAGISPARIDLGGSFRLSIGLRGETNLWEAPSPRDALAAVPGLEVLEHPAQLARDAGRTLALRRYFVFDLVPHTAGALQLPDIRVPYFDPATGRYDEARVELPSVVVNPVPAPRRGGAPRREAEPREEPGAPRGRGWWLGAAALVGLGAAALATLRRRRGPGAAGGAALLEAAREAAVRGDAEAAGAAAARALRAGLAEAVPGARSLSADEIAERAPDRARSAAALLTRIERERFSSAARLPDVDELERVLAGLRAAER